MNKYRIFRVSSSHSLINIKFKENLPLVKLETYHMTLVRIKYCKTMSQREVWGGLGINYIVPNFYFETDSPYMQIFHGR